MSAHTLKPTAPLDSHPQWMGWVLRAAAVYNVLWGAWVVLFPNHFFALVGMEPPLHPSIWQCVGMIVGVYGIGYWIAANAPYRHWPIVLVGMLGKIFGPIGYVQGAFIDGTLDPAFGATIPTNDVIWWVPFAMMLWGAFRAHQDDGYELQPVTPESFREALESKQTAAGTSLAELSRGNTLAVVLLRHSGCTFCREALADLKRTLPKLREQGVEPVVVMQSCEADMQALLERYGLGSLQRVSDPERVLYRAFELPRGSFLQLFGPRVFFQALRAMRHGVGQLDGDGLQMPGTFLVSDAKVIKAYRHRSAGDRVDMDTFCSLPPQTSSTDAPVAAGAAS